MAEQLIIQLLDETPIAPLPTDDASEAGEHVPQRRFRWGLVDELSVWSRDANEGYDDDLVNSLKGVKRPAVLLLPGHKVVTTLVPYDKKQARHFMKMLPYQIEEEVLGDVEQLHFATGSKSGDDNGELISVAHVDANWLSELLGWFKDRAINIDRCYADFQCLLAEGEELNLWFTGGSLWGHRANGQGFSVAQELAQPLLKDLLAHRQDEEFPWSVNIYVADRETAEIVTSHILPPVEYRMHVGEPALDFHQPNQLNLATGIFGKRLPVDQWWQEAKALVWLAAAAFVVFLGAGFADIYSLKQQRADNQAATLAAFRTVIPQGPATDPARRLRARLGPQGDTSEESSNSVLLLAKIAPVLNGLDMVVDTLSYTQRDLSLRINVKAKSFNAIEQLRRQLAATGVSARLQSSNAVDSGFAARLVITPGQEV